MDKATLEQKFQSLPDDIKSAMTSPEIAEKIQSIAQTHKLHVDQAGILENEVSLTMLGAHHPDDFVNQIEEKLGVSMEEAIAIAVDVNEQIFLSIRDSLMKMQEESEETETEAATAQTSPVKSDPTLASKPEPKTTQGPSLSELEATPELPEGVTSKEDLLAEIETHAAAIPSLAEVKAATIGQSPQPVQPKTPPVEPSAPKPPEKPKTYTADPYREPLM